MKKTITIFLIIFLILMLPACQSEDEKYPWRKDTKPLPPEMVLDLCETFNVDDKKLCDDNKPVYADQFFGIIRESFPSEITTYDDVEAKLSAYQVEKGDLIIQPGSYNCYEMVYDFVGDSINNMTFIFYENNQLIRIMFNYGDYDNS